MKTAELTGADLDYWVARAEGLSLKQDGDGSWFVHQPDRRIQFVGSEHLPEYVQAEERYSPSVNWRDGGPIIQRERLHLAPALPRSRLRWDCFTTPPEQKDEPWFNGSGDTPLIAAMRAFVSSVFGPDVDATALPLSKN